MKVIRLMLVFCCSITLNMLFGQISGFVGDQSQQPVAFANVVLLQLPDSNFLTGTVTDDSGSFSLQSDHVSNGLLKVSALGYKDQWRALENHIVQYEITLGNASLQLEQVVVTGKKALYELQQDRLVVNISASPAFSGNTALQLLQKSPGVVVNRQNQSVSLNAKGEALIMINNKIQRVPMAVLLARLEGMRAENIEKIELIHQPSARYDASGAAGIIHIVLKENNQQGTNGNGSLMGGYGQGPKAGINLGFNARSRLINCYGDYSFNLDNHDEYTVNHFREYDLLGDDYYYENFVTLNNRRTRQHAANLGVDIDLGQQTVLGFLFSYGHAKDLMGAVSNSKSFINNTPIDALNFSLFPETNMESAIGNINLFHHINDQSSLNLDIDNAVLDFENIGNISNDDTNEAILADRQTPIDIWTVKLDNVNQLNENTKLEIGIKGTFSKIESDARVQNINNSEWVGNTLFSGEDRINERILATYASISKDFSDKVNAEVGLRFEHFDYQLDAANDANDFKQVFNNPFPIVRLNYKLDSLNTLQATFNRTIVRPAFSNLTAFFIFLDPSILVFANPQLKPTFTNTYKISWQHRSIIFSLSYLRTINRLYFFNTVDKPNHIQTSSPNNLDLSTIIEGNISFPLYITSWWSMNWNLNLLYQSVEDASKRPLPFEKSIYTFTGQVNSSFSWGQGWSASFDGRYMSDFLDGDQVKYLYPYLNLGVRKQFTNGSAVSLSLQDITNSIGRIEWEYHQPAVGIRTFGANDWSERQLRLTYTFNLGNEKLRAKRQRSSGEDARSRM